uniref:Immunoglobulin domain-containing protein n=1 Tax=Maylandia zebra TaxID=106582 RepID=A0A3P9DSB3_9CICH
MFSPHCNVFIKPNSNQAHWLCCRLLLNFPQQYITTVSKVSVKTGKSISIPCLYESKYRNHVKYFCEGAKWRSCNDVVKTNTADPSGKYSISDDKNQFFFTVTINNLTNENTDYWCVVEINNGPDYGEHFQLSVTSDKLVLINSFLPVHPISVPFYLLPVFLVIVCVFRFMDIVFCHSVCFVCVP